MCCAGQTTPSVSLRARTSRRSNNRGGESIKPDRQTVSSAVALARRAHHARSSSALHSAQSVSPLRRRRRRQEKSIQLGIVVRGQRTVVFPPEKWDRQQLLSDTVVFCVRGPLVVSPFSHIITQSLALQSSGADETGESVINWDDSEIHASACNQSTALPL